MTSITEVALFLSRWTELSVLGKATILLALGLTAAWLARRSRASVRHLVLAATFAALVALPLILATVPGVAIVVPVSHAAASTEAVIPAPPFTAIPLSPGSDLGRQTLEIMPSWPVIVRYVWIAGALLLLMPLALNLWFLRQLRRNGLPWPELQQRTQSLAAESGVRHPVEVLLLEDISAPLTCGVWRPAILLPCDARERPEAELRWRSGPRVGACPPRRLGHSVDGTHGMLLLLVPSDGLDGLAKVMPRSRASL